MCIYARLCIVVVIFSISLAVNVMCVGLHKVHMNSDNDLQFLRIMHTVFVLTDRQTDNIR